MTAAVLVFAALGAAVVGVGALLVPQRPGLLAAIGRLDAARSPTPTASTTAPAETWSARQVRLGQLAINRLPALARLGRTHIGPAGNRTADLAITGRSDELLLGRQILTGLVGLLALPALAVALAPSGVRLPLPVLAVGAPLLGTGLALLPALSLHRDAQERRREFRHALACYLDLVAMSLAGGRGAPQALAETAALSTSWPFRMLDDAVATARLAATSPWREFAALGQRIGVGELDELAASLALVGDHGARVRETLAARASTLRRRALTDAEGDAAQADQTMRIAQVLLAFGFLILIAYPALAAVLAL
ncbi:MAG: type II secretion system F family protein [Sporichthyaceae bacterium]